MPSSMPFYPSPFNRKIYIFSAVYMIIYILGDAGISAASALYSLTLYIVIIIPVQCTTLHSISFHLLFFPPPASPVTWDTTRPQVITFFLLSTSFSVRHKILTAGECVYALGMFGTLPPPKTEKKISVLSTHISLHFLHAQIQKECVVFTWEYYVLEK